MPRGVTPPGLRVSSGRQASNVSAGSEECGNIIAVLQDLNLHIGYVIPQHKTSNHFNKLAVIKAFVGAPERYIFRGAWLVSKCFPIAYQLYALPLILTVWSPFCRFAFTHSMRTSPSYHFGCATYKTSRIIGRLLGSRK